MIGEARRRLPYEILIRDVISKDLCAGCGTCAGICPRHVLRMQRTVHGTYMPQVVSQDCSGCSLCTDVCPVNNDGYAELNEAVFGKIPKNALLGNFIKCYTGYSADPEIRWRATSGGVITALLLFLLEKRYIDGALVTRMTKGDPLKGEAFIARTGNEIREAMGSKYVPIPVNELLSQILSERGRFAVVGLPCHIQGVRRAELKNPVLRERIAFRFGLVCSRTMSFQGVEYVLRRIGIARKDIAELKFRGEGWPSGLRVLSRDGSRRHLPMLNTWWSEVFGGYFFSHDHCLWCADLMSEMADVSFADAYLQDIQKNDTVGTSIVIARTSKGQEILDAAVVGANIELSALSASDALRSQIAMTLFKKRNIKARMTLRRMLCRPIPRSVQGCVDGFLKPTIWDYIMAPVPSINIRISRNRLLRRLLEHIPFRVIRCYRMTFKERMMHKAQEVIERVKLLDE